MTETQIPTLAEKMRAYAAAHLNGAAAEVFEAHADALDALDYDTPIPKLVGTWAKARRAWCNETGEDLV